MNRLYEQAVALIRSARYVAVLTGAGVSTLSGIADFRGKSEDSFYNDPEKMKTFDLAWFDRDPTIFYRNVRPIMDQIFKAKPNLVHRMLADLERAGIVKGVITQNIDHLHQDAGSGTVFEVHGNCAGAYCRSCRLRIPLEEFKLRMERELVPHCSCGGVFKPDVTFFGEELPEQAVVGAMELVRKADLLLVLGTSLTVYPVAALPQETLRNGGKLVIVNAQPTYLDDKAAMVFPDLKEFAEKIQALALKE